LLELLPDPDAFVKELNALQIPGVEYHREKSVKCGITGTHIRVTVHGEEEGSSDLHEHHHEYDHDHQEPDHHHDHDHAHQEPDHHHDHDYDHQEPDHHHDHDHDHQEPDHHHDHDYDHQEPDHHHDHDYDHQEPDHRHDHAHDHHHTHHHTSLHEIEHIVRDHLHLPKNVQDDVMAVYRLIAEAESHAHDRPVEEIHFHEVGTMDAIADVVAVCLLLDRIAPDEIVVSPVHVGSGQVRCAHGILPVPAPATAYILKDVPIYGGAVQGELCTPTGAALLKHFATRFAEMPMMRISAVGYGMGKKDFEAANCVRAMLGESSGRNTERVFELSCNVDDMTGEEIGFAMERLFETGARDVFTVPVGMKKNRPGILLKVICTEEDKDAIVIAIFRYTTTIGIRECEMKRYVLDRRVESMETPYGTVHCKISDGYEAHREKLEYEDLAGIAKKQGISLREVKERVVTKADQ